MGLIEDLKPGPVALDTQVFIYFIEEDKRYLPLVKSLFEAIDQGSLPASTSGLTLMEVLVVPYRTGNISLADRYEALLTRSRGLFDQRPQNSRHTGIENLSTQKLFVAKRPLTRICLKCFSIQHCHSKLRNRSPHSFTMTVYRIILSASASTLGGNVRPICFAAFKLMMNSNLVGCSMGRSAGFAPLRILST